jgi:hypothetical protein
MIVMALIVVAVLIAERDVTEIDGNGCSGGGGS